MEAAGFSAIIAVGKLIGQLAWKMRDDKNQSKHKCSHLAERVEDLDGFLRNYPQAAVYDKATQGVQRRLKAALDEALELIKYCQHRSVFSCKTWCRFKVAELDNVDKKISNCILELTFMSQARGHVSNNNNCSQGKGGALGACSGSQPPPVQYLVTVLPTQLAYDQAQEFVLNRVHEVVLNRLLEEPSAREEEAKCADEAAVNPVLEERTDMATVNPTRRSADSFIAVYSARFRAAVARADEEAKANRVVAEKSMEWASWLDEENLQALFTTDDEPG